MPFQSNHCQKLHNGLEIPTLGYRIDAQSGKDIYRLTLAALNAGFRHLDLPADEDAELQAGKAIEDSGIPRYQIFLSVKLPNKNHGKHAVIHAFERSMKRLGTDYADLYLVEWPNPAKFRATYHQTSAETWHAVEEIYKAGNTRAIGLCNHQARHIEDNLEFSEIAPMVNQARLYPGFPFRENLDCAKLHGILTEGYLPVQYQDIANSRELKIFAKKYNVSSRLICMRYILQKKCIILAQAKKQEEFDETPKVFDFEIAKEDMQFLDVMENYGPKDIDPDTCPF